MSEPIAAKAFLSAAEIAGIIGVTPKCIRQWGRTRADDFPAPSGPGLRLLDSLWVLPKHKLEGALKAGTFAKAWGTDTPPSDIVGTGPFVLREYLPNQRLVFDRNPRYWRKAQDGTPLPYLDRIVYEIIPDQDAASS